jgi:protocatechuate 3,4-dioxygenase beta subunit
VGRRTRPTASACAAQVPRRQALAVVGAAGAALAFGCGGNTPASPTPPGGGGATCAVTPSETAGTSPSLSDLVRSDIREGRPGTPLTLTVAVVNAGAACGPVAGVNVEIWQCDAAGNYSQYGTEQNQTFLRGIQTTDASGEVVFTTIYPGWYQGRATHIHLEVQRAGSSLKITQIAFPETTSAAVYRTGPYALRGTNPTSNAQDSVFADSLGAELASVSGDAANGLSASFRVVISS